MQSTHTMLFAAALLFGVGTLGACATHDKRTLAELRDIEPDLAEVQVDNGLEEAMRGYRSFLEEAPESSLTPEAMRRLADLKLEKEYGILGGDAGTMPAPQARAIAPTPQPPAARDTFVEPTESDQAFEARVALEAEVETDGAALILPDGQETHDSGPREAIALYDEILAKYPSYEHNDRVLYQKARAFDELGLPDEAIEVIEHLIATYPYSRHIDEVQFRRAEYFFTRRRYLDAEEAYAAITARGPVSDFYELALYKLGWSLYKQELHEEALHQYVALLDHKVSTGYDFEQSEDQEASRRVEDTFRVVSLSFSSIGGPEFVTAYFEQRGTRSYEDRIYSHLGEFYFEKLRYQDAASAYEAFVTLYPEHRSAPHFGIRVVEIYEAGGFPLLVLTSKKDFAARYGLDAPYWQHFSIEEAPEVVAYLKDNLQDLATHYHAEYQDPERSEEAEESFGEARRWYRAFLASFPSDEETPAIHRQLADLLLEHEDFGDAALEYERTAYDYPAHAQAAEAGYAAIYAHRQDYEVASEEARPPVRRAAVASTLRFVDAFPAHEHAAVVLGTAVDDLYEMDEYEAAIANGRRLIEAYPEAEAAILRSAWLAVAHSAFDILDYPQAEEAYSRVLAFTSDSDESRQGIIDNLAAAIYQQGELATQAQDHQTAADHFLRVAEVAPDSAIRPTAEYDAGAALIRLEDWDAAVQVLDDFRKAHPDHALREEATKQLAQIYRDQGQLERSASEYERIAAEAEDEELSREALLVAGSLYKDAQVPERAVEVLETYVARYPDPLETALETRFELASLHADLGNTDQQHLELRLIVEADHSAGASRTDRIRYLAARSALVLTEENYERFAAVELVQPFDKSLKEKRRRMDAALREFGQLVDYEVGEVTAAATFYMAEVYRDFSESLLASERPSNISQAELDDYELVLEEEAYPFEEKAIAVHEKNLELMDTGIFNRWIERSLSQLAVLMPGRYAKFEESSGLLESVDRYAYHAPKPAVEAPVQGSKLPIDAVPASQSNADETLPTTEPGQQTEIGDDTDVVGI